MKGIYLAAFIADHPNYNIDYQDINGLRDIPGDMLDVILFPYDFIIATPPCNFYSRANYRRYNSNYSLKTRKLLPCIIDKLINIGKPFIVENVVNDSLIPKRFNCYNFEIGNHHYWTNVLLYINDIDISIQNKQYISRKKRQGGLNVHNVIEKFLFTIHYTNYQIYKAG